MVMVWCSKCLYTLLLLLIVNSVDWSVGRPSVIQSSVILDMDEEGRSEVTQIVDNDHQLVEQRDHQENPEMQLEQDKLMELNQELRLKLLEQLGFPPTVIPTSTYTQETNISRAEYLRAYTEYMTNVRERRRRERTQSSTHPKMRRSQAEIFVQHYTANKEIQTEDDEVVMNNVTMNKRISFEFPVQIKLLNEPKYRLQVRKASLFLPVGCSALELKGNDNNEEEVEVKSLSIVPVDVTRDVSRWMLISNTNMDENEMPLRMSVNCLDKNDNMSSSLSIVWMKTKMGGGDVVNRVRRSMKDNQMERVGGQQRGQQHQRGGGDGGHNRRHHLSDFVAAEGEEATFKGMRGGGKKRGGDCGQMKHGKSCCRKPLTVSFEDLKITDVILAPTRFDMDYCEGRCNAKRLPYATTHAMFQHIINRSKNADLQAPKLCCTPTKLSELDVIQIDPDSPNALKVTVIHNAKVEECGCS